MEIYYHGKTYRTERLGTELNDHLAKRLWFIIKLNPLNDIEYLEAERLSRVWFNMTYMGCRYSDEIEERIFDLSNK